MVETSEACRAGPGPSWSVWLDWGFRGLLVVCAGPSLFAVFGLTVVFAGHPGSWLRAMASSVPGLLACAVLLLPWRVLFRRHLRMAGAWAAACIAAHQVYSSFSTWKNTIPPGPRFVFCCIVLALGATSLLVYVRRTRLKTWLAGVSLLPVLICFIFGSGNPQWSRWIFVWQVHYSPWRTDAENLPTNRSPVRLRRPKYTEWDARGRKSREWTHPNGLLVRTDYYPDGTKRSESVRGKSPYTTHWDPSGRVTNPYDRQTRPERHRDPNSTPLEGISSETRDAP